MSDSSVDIERALAIVKRGSDQLLVESDFVVKLERARASGTPLRCKLGLDRRRPTSIWVTQWC